MWADNETRCRDEQRETFASVPEWKSFPVPGDALPLTKFTCRQGGNWTANWINYVLVLDSEGLFRESLPDGTFIYVHTCTVQYNITGQTNSTSLHLPKVGRLGCEWLLLFCAKTLHFKARGQASFSLAGPCYLQTLASLSIFSNFLYLSFLNFNIYWHLFDNRSHIAA